MSKKLLKWYERIWIFLAWPFITLAIAFFFMLFFGACILTWPCLLFVKKLEVGDEDELERAKEE